MQIVPVLYQLIMEAGAFFVVNFSNFELSFYKNKNTKIILNVIKMVNAIKNGYRSQVFLFSPHNNIILLCSL